MCGFDVARAPGEDRKRISQRGDQATCRAHVGAAIAVGRMQLRVGDAVQIAPIQREVLASEPAQRRGGVDVRRQGRARRGAGRGFRHGRRDLAVKDQQVARRLSIGFEFDKQYRYI